MKNLITVPQAANLLNVSAVRVRQLCITGQLAAQKPGRDWIISTQSINNRIRSKPQSGRPRK